MRLMVDSMTWMEWGFAIFFGVLLSLLAYSILSTALEIRKKAQPFADTFFDGLYNLMFGKRVSQRDKPPDPKQE